jgi:hypothetical protein
MAVIDTLRLARAPHDKGGFSQEAADATAEAINAALGEDVATKSDIRLLDGKINLLVWAVGINRGNRDHARQALVSLSSEGHAAE